MREKGGEVIAPIRFRFPWPPSNNTYYRHARGVTFIGAAGLAYRQTVAAYVIASGFHRERAMIVDPIPMVAIYASRPDRRRYDVDNCLKAVSDCMTRARVWKDDSQIQGLTIRKRFDANAEPHLTVAIYLTETTLTMEHSA